MIMAAPIDLNPKSVLLSSGIGALGSLGSAVLGGLFNRSNMAAQVEKSKELMQYQWDHFQSPQAQVNALAAAGINPAVALGQGGSGFTATPSAAMPTSQPVPIPDIGTIGQFVQAMAMAKKAGLDSVAQQLQNQYDKETMDARIEQVGLANHYTREQINNLQQEWNLLVSKINMLSTESEIKKIDLSKHGEMVDAIINHYVSQKNLNDEEAKNIRDQLPEILNKLKNENRILDVDAQVAETYQGTMAGLGALGKVLTIIEKIAKFFK